MSDERVKPFVAWMVDTAVDGTYSGGYFNRERSSSYTRPVVVTPLLPDDPRVGETWLGRLTGDRKVITSAPFRVRAGYCVGVAGPHGPAYDNIGDLCRPPVLKTFRLPIIPGIMVEPLTIKVQAESREAALAKLAESLEEIP